MLASVQRIFETFSDNGILYCHWKSNERLPIFVSGESDLDLLFLPSDKEMVDYIFKTCGAKQFCALPKGKYPNIFDYLIIDDETGNLVHFHVHFGLDIGEKNVKRFAIPWSNDVLKHRVVDERVKVWRSSAEHELLLLILRESLRHPISKRLINAITFRKAKIAEQVLNEFSWLKKRANSRRFDDLVGNFFSEKGVRDQIERIFNDGISYPALITLSSEMRCFKKNATMGEMSANLLFLVRLLNARLSWVKSLLNRPARRVNLRGGTLAVFVGSDGAGKSTVIAGIAKELARKVDCKTFYLGLPKPKSKSERIIHFGLRKVGLWPLYNLLYKASTLRRARKFSQRGGVALCDRFPQSDFDGIMDGPLLSKWRVKSSYFKRTVASLEHRAFKKIQSHSIDLLVKLNIDALTSSERGALPLETAKKKVKVVRDVSFLGASEVCEIDAAANGIDDVTRLAIAAVWKRVK